MNEDIIQVDNKSLIEKHLEILRGLQAPSGLFLASMSGVPTGYDKAWLRDNFYISLALEQVGEWEMVKKLWRAILDIFLKHEHKINWAIEHRPHESWQYIHARYHPETFEEYWEEWGNKQNDAVGAILFKLGDLEEKEQGVIKNEEDRRIIQKLIDYLYRLSYWEDPDSGVWEENEEVHASSVGAVLAGLKKINALGIFKIAEEAIQKGEEALLKILPRESAGKFSDLALLSLIYPFQIINSEMADQILANIEYYFLRRRGVIRYKNDRYYNKNIDGWSEEAEWTIGLPWLSIIYQRQGDTRKAKEYLEKAKNILLPENKIPELYLSNTDKPNQNIPLGWAESLFIIALLEIENF